MAAATRDPAPPTRIVGVGASAGGVEALTALVRHLPADLPAAVVVVLHVPSTGTSVLAQILDRAGALPAVPAEDGQPLLAGRVHVAPPDRHLLVDGDVLRLSTGPRENGHRPAVDPLFVSLAAFGDRAVGVLLSGTRDDGVRGLLTIKSRGGTVLVQDPEEALFDGMIRNAQRSLRLDAVLPLARLATHLDSLSRTTSAMAEATNDPTPVPDRADRTATRFTCPDCGGVIWRHEEGPALTFACSVGHAYSPESFDAEQARYVEHALWAAARLLGDRRTLLEEMAERAADDGHGRSAAAFRDQAGEIATAASTIRRLIESGRLPLPAGSPDLQHG